jgi:hypothetical protein
LALVMAALPGCGGGDQPAVEPKIEPVRNTIMRADVGDRLTVTAVVDRQLEDGSFVVTDADLPESGLVVLTTRPPVLKPQMLVTVDGTIDRLTVVDHRHPLLADAVPYHGRKVLVADRVRVW